MHFSVPPFEVFHVGNAFNNVGCNWESFNFSYLLQKFGLMFCIAWGCKTLLYVEHVISIWIETNFMLVSQDEILLLLWFLVVFCYEKPSLTEHWANSIMVFLHRKYMMFSSYYDLDKTPDLPLLYFTEVKSSNPWFFFPNTPTYSLSVRVTVSCHSSICSVLHCQGQQWNMVILGSNEIVSCLL